MKKLRGLLMLAGICAAIAALTAQAPSASSGPLVQIVTAEQQRTVAGGVLERYLNGPDERLAVRASLAMGRTKRPAAIAALLPHLHDSRRPVRAMAAYALGIIGAQQIVPALPALMADRSGAVRIAALDASERLEGARKLDATAEPKVARAVSARLRFDRDPIVRGRAAAALAAFADGQAGFFAEQQLVSALGTDSSDSVRWHVMWTIFRKYALQVPRKVLTAHLHDRSELVRIEAVRAYGRLHNADAISTLLPSLNDPSWRVQEQAAEALRALRGQSATEHLTSIAATVHLPPIPPDPFAGLAVQPRGSTPAGPPVAASVQGALLPDPQSAAQMTSPVPGAHPQLRLVTTQGNVYVVLFPEWAPLTVENFLNLAGRGFFDNNRWFRIVPDFVVQTGEQDDKNAPGPGYTIGAEENPMEQRDGVVSMGLDYDAKTNTPLRDSAGSEWYITLSPQLHLDLDFSVFGRVVWGDEVLAHLTESDRIIRVERVTDATL